MSRTVRNRIESKARRGPAAEYWKGLVQPAFREESRLRAQNLNPGAVGRGMERFERKCLAGERAAPR